jgi:glycosyltransferase involved in cell wall biosynthesis
MITIIIVTLNAGEVLEKTIQSGIAQKYPNFEIVLIDGKSTDNTLEIVKKYEKYLSYWVSEKDSGIYDAMNKGVKKAKGNFVIFLNAGDYFVGDVLSNFRGEECILPVRYENKAFGMQSRKLGNIKLGTPYCHQGYVLRKPIDAMFDLRYRIVADYEYLVRSNVISLPILASDGYVYYDNKGFSQKNAKKRDSEIASVILKYFGSFAVVRYWIYVRMKRLALLAIKPFKKI